MKKIFFLILMYSIYLSSQDWTKIGPDSSAVNDYFFPFETLYSECLATDSGLTMTRNIAWVKYKLGLPVKRAFTLDFENLLLIAGNGSKSDGVYKFSLSQEKFDLVDGLYKPAFLQYNNLDSTYFAGGENGLLKIKHGKDSLIIEPVSFFSDKKCSAIAMLDSLMIVASDSGIYFTDKISDNWEKVKKEFPVSKFLFDYDGTLFAVYPGESRSSGLYSSTDYGITWKVEYYSTNLSALYHYGNYIVLGWSKSEQSGKSNLGLFNRKTGNIQYLEGLPPAEINRITENMIINCPNLIVCTDSGAFQTCAIPVMELTIEPDTLIFLPQDSSIPSSLITNTGTVSVFIDSISVTENWPYHYNASIVDTSINGFPVKLNPNESVELEVLANYPLNTMQTIQQTVDTLSIYISYLGKINIYRIILILNPPIVTVNEQEIFPNDYSLSQNYPNPFNPVTTIEYTLPAGRQEFQFVQLKIYNILAQEVATLVNKQQSAGTYKISFDASQLPSGVYFYRLQAGNFSKGAGKGFTGTRKMILMK